MNMSVSLNSHPLSRVTTDTRATEPAGSELPARSRVQGVEVGEGSAMSHPGTLVFPREGCCCFDTGKRGGRVGTPRSLWVLYLIVQRAEVLEAAKAGVAQADQDGEQHDQEGEQGGRGLQT